MACCKRGEKMLEFYEPPVVGICRHKTLKSTIMGLCGLLLVAALATMVAVLVQIHSPNNLLYLMNDLDSSRAINRPPSQFGVIETAMITVSTIGSGLILFVLLGIVCINSEKYCPIVVFTVILGLMLIGTIVATILYFIFIQWLDFYLKSDLYKGMSYYEGVHSAVNHFSRSLNMIQRRLSCCGIETYEDFRGYAFRWEDRSIHRVPESCCQVQGSDLQDPQCPALPTTLNSFIQRPCYNLVRNYIRRWMSYLTMAALIFTVPMILTITLSCWLLTYISNKRKGLEFMASPQRKGAVCYTPPILQSEPCSCAEAEMNKNPKCCEPYPPPPPWPSRSLFQRLLGRKKTKRKEEEEAEKEKWANRGTTRPCARDVLHALLQMEGQCQVQGRRPCSPYQEMLDDAVNMTPKCHQAAPPPPPWPSPPSFCQRLRSGKEKEMKVCRRTLQPCEEDPLTGLHQPCGPIGSRNCCDGSQRPHQRRSLDYQSDHGGTCHDHLGMFTRMEDRVCNRSSHKPYQWWSSDYDNDNCGTCTLHEGMAPRPCCPDSHGGGHRSRRRSRRKREDDYDSESTMAESMPSRGSHSSAYSKTHFQEDNTDVKDEVGTEESSRSKSSSPGSKKGLAKIISWFRKRSKSADSNPEKAEKAETVEKVEEVEEKEEPPVKRQETPPKRSHRRKQRPVPPIPPDPPPGQNPYRHDLLRENDQEWTTEEHFSVTRPGPDLQLTATSGHCHCRERDTPKPTADRLPAILVQPGNDRRNVRIDFL